jgi:hypothetical protein
MRKRVSSMPRVLLVPVLALAAGCAPREAFFRPADRRAVGRDGYVGAAWRVPPEAADSQAQAVAALSPLIRERGPAGGESRAVWRLAAVIEFRNKRAEPIVFLPESVTLVTPEHGERRPLAVTRAGRAEELTGSVRIPHWHRACFQAHWLLPADDGAPAGPLELRWTYDYAGRRHPQRTAFAATDSRLAERSLAGDPTGMVTETRAHSSSGVPFLMHLPFVGVLFRTDASVRSRSSTTFGTSIGSRGTWWPLEPAPGADSPFNVER